MNRTAPAITINTTALRTTLPLFAAACFAGCGPADDGQASRGVAPAIPASDADAAARLSDEALKLIAKRAVFAPVDREGVMMQMLSVYLGTEDAYSGFLTRDEYARYRSLAKGPHGGIDMDLERHRDGETFCYPVAGGAADRAGIKAGERLLAIDGTSVKGKPLALLAARAAGPEGTSVLLEVADANGAARRLSIVRARLAEASLTVTTSLPGGRPVIRISSFTAATRAQVEAELQQRRDARSIVFDLRGCGGGDFYAAVDTAMLFLDKGAPIVTVSERGSAHSYASTLERRTATQAVYLWQDEATASAAEVFIGALTGNGRGVSIGVQSAGKGSTQDIVQLAGGSALILTTGYLTVPPGRAFNGTGLPPGKPLPPHADTQAYVSATPRTE